MNELNRLITTYKIRWIDLSSHIDTYTGLIYKYAVGERKISYRIKKRLITVLNEFAQKTQKNMEQLQKDLTKESLQYIVENYRIKKKDLARIAKVDPSSLTKYLKGTVPMNVNMKKNLTDSLDKIAQDTTKRMSLLQKELKKWWEIDDTDD